MKLAIWIVFGLLALVWTGGALLTSELAQWGGRLLAGGDAAALGRAAADWPVPRWLDLWADPRWVQAARQGMVWALESLQGAVPWVGSAVGWLVPAIWTVWGLFLALMLMLAAGLHVLVGRTAGPTAR